VLKEKDGEVEEEDERRRNLAKCDNVKALGRRLQGEIRIEALLL